MNKIGPDLFWQLFKETGDPLCWVLYRRGSADPRREGKGTRTPSRG